jgi:uncharacterized protein
MLQSVPGIDELTYQQAAGFLRVRNGEHPLDGTAVHPESYPIVEKMAAALGVQLADLVGNHERVSALKLEDFVDESAGMPTLNDIREELLRPGRDPRKTFALPKFRADVKQIGDLKEGMTLEGTVTNVTNFGAFVDIGVHQDGLVHLSQMSNRFIRDPREAVKVGDVVHVKVISVEVETKRIGLSMKALLPPIPRRRKRPRPVRRPSRQPVPAGAEAAASSVSSTPDGAPVPAAEAGPRPPRNSNRNRNRPRHSRPRPERPREFIPHDKEPKAEEPKGPEPTLQEKIAILQSKFRGIS